MTDEAIELAEVRATNERIRHAALERLAGELARTGILEEACEELQAGLIGQWLASESLEQRDKCWHEARAVEFVRLKLADKLAPPDSENYAAIVESTFAGSSRWVRFMRAIRARLLGRHE